MSKETSLIPGTEAIVSVRTPSSTSASASSAGTGTIVRLPANVPHAVDAPEAARMLLVMLRDPQT